MAAQFNTIPFPTLNTHNPTHSPFLDAATAWMFPWERRQLQGGALRPWEKFYWGVFVVAISLVLFNRLRDPPVPPDPAIKEAKEAAKAERARQVLAGASLVDGEDDPFEGMTPEVSRGRNRLLACAK